MEKRSGFIFIVTLFNIFVWTWLIVIRTLLTLTHRRARYSCIKTFAIFFLTLGFFTVASLKLLEAIWSKLIFLLYRLLRLLDLWLTVFMIWASIADAFWSAKLPWRKAFTVHLKALGFLTNTSSAFLFWSSSRFSMLCFTFLLHIKRALQWILIIVDLWLWLSDIFLEKWKSTDWEVFFRLNQKESFTDKWYWWQIKETVFGKREMTHVLWISSN